MKWIQNLSLPVFDVKRVLNRKSERISRTLSKRIKDPDFVPINFDIVRLILIIFRD
tara:strand:- start:1631 stop:1798 length:168 start_codon:yes stop_codon:yes gene_type:complete